MRRLKIMACNYLYIEDEKESSKSYQRVLEKNGIVKIKIYTPLKLKEQIDFIKNNIAKFDGLLLDLRLDEQISDNIKPDYSTATSLAQEIRIRAAEGYLKKELPIILISTVKQISKTKAFNYTSEDLFDFKICKEDISKHNWGMILYSLANGYKLLAKKNNISEMLNIRNTKYIDDRIINKFTGHKKISIFQYSRFILNELVQKSGPFIDDKVLAARLGIDIENSKDWHDLLIELNSAKYKGIYSDAWDRWWFSKILEWWNKTIGKSYNLASLTANERVELIKHNLKLKKIKTAIPIEHNKSSHYWTICRVYEKPLDPLEGFSIDEKEIEPWQDINYVSFDALLERQHILKGIRLTPLEESRYKETKKFFLKK